MSFQAWMRKQGLSESSVKKYAGAIDTSLSHWARSAGLTSIALNKFTDTQGFDAVASQIRKLDVFRDRNLKGHGMYASALNQFSYYLAAHQADGEKGADERLIEDLEAIHKDRSIAETTREQLYKARIGQGIFRKQVIEYWGKCSATGYGVANMLVASHIKPWSISSNSERLDPFNGLLLTPNIDKAFDKGLISFDEIGKVLISKALINPANFGIPESLNIKLTPKHQEYMAHHRGTLFKTG